MMTALRCRSFSQSRVAESGAIRPIAVMAMVATGQLQGYPVFATVTETLCKDIHSAPAASDAVVARLIAAPHSPWRLLWWLSQMAQQVKLAALCRLSMCHLMHARLQQTQVEQKVSMSCTSKCYSTPGYVVDTCIYTCRLLHACFIHIVLFTSDLGATILVSKW